MISITELQKQNCVHRELLTLEELVDPLDEKNIGKELAWNDENIVNQVDRRKDGLVLDNKVHQEKLHHFFVLFCTFKVRKFTFSYLFLPFLPLKSWNIKKKYKKVKKSDDTFPDVSYSDEEEKGTSETHLGHKAAIQLCQQFKGYCLNVGGEHSLGLAQHLCCF